jgi:hypothetical protein
MAVSNKLPIFAVDINHISMRLQMNVTYNKEFDGMSGLNTSDHGARQHDLNRLKPRRR